MVLNPWQEPAMAVFRCAIQMHPGRTGAQRGIALRRRCLLACLGLAVLAPTTAAQLGDTPGWTAWDSGLQVSREALDTRWSSVVRLPASRPDYSLGDLRPMRAWGAGGMGTSFIDIPQHFAGAEAPVYVRPQFALGGTSDSLRLLMRGAGFDATKCVAPLMKMKSGFAGSSTHANVSFSARCSLH